MDDGELKRIASQLSCPSGENALELGERMSSTNAFMIERCIEMLSVKPGERIVEIGLGNGLRSIPIVKSLEKNGVFIGIERSTQMAQEASNQLQQDQFAQVKIHTGDYRDAPIEDSTIDGLIAINVLYFIEDLTSFLAKIATWLRPGGRIVFGVRPDISLKKMPFTRFEFNLRPLEEITEELQSNGFSDVESLYFDEGTTTAAGIEVPLDSQIIKAVIN